MIEQYITPALLVAILVFLWKIQSDINSLSQRIATIEGWIKGRFPDVSSTTAARPPIAAG